MIRIAALAALLLSSCTADSDPMLANQHITTTLSPPEPLDPLDPATPRQGHFEVVELQPPTTMSPAFAEGLQQEIIGMQTALGVPPLPDNRQLAKLMESGGGPTPTTLPMIFSVAAAEIAQRVQYQRMGHMITVSVDISWLNTNGAIAGNQAYVELPFEVDTSIQFTPGSGSSIALSQSTFQLGDVAQDAYEFAPPGTFGAAQSQTALRRIPQIGASVTVIIGSSGLDGGQSRGVVGMLTYMTNGVRNPEWPFIIWTSFPDVHTVLPSAEVWFEYDSAKVGDVIDLLDSGMLVVQSLPALGVGDVPNGKASFTVAAADTYYVRLRGVVSQGYVVD